MGYIRHKAIIITSYNKAAIDDVAKKALSLGLQITVSDESIENGFYTMTVCPSGRKSGWETTEWHNKAQKQFIGYLNAFRNSDNSSCLEWVAISYGNDDYSAKITANTWDVKIIDD